jgi:hypothetical protein
MSFRLFIYYCTLSGAWGAFLACLVVFLVDIRGSSSAILQGTVIGALVGVLVSISVGTLDALINSTGFSRVVRVLVGGGVGLLGGMLGGLVGTLLKAAYIPAFIGWMLCGMGIGISVGVWDVIQASAQGKSARGALRKMMNGLIGGLVGGLIGGVPVEFLQNMTGGGFGRTIMTAGLILLGASIGLLIGLAQVAFREAWIKVEAGFRPGRELILTKEETVIGRGEGCDVGLFGDSKVEKVHARIKLDGDRYVLVDANTPGGTYLNDERIGEDPVPLRNGDLIEVGNSVLRFGTRQRDLAPAKRARRGDGERERDRDDKQGSRR